MKHEKGIIKFKRLYCEINTKYLHMFKMFVDSWQYCANTGTRPSMMGIASEKRIIRGSCHYGNITGELTQT